MKDALKNQKKDIAWLIKNSSKFTTVPCPACGSEESSFEFAKFTFQFFKCATCNTVYMKSRANDALLREFYQRSELYSYWDKYIFPVTRKTRIERLFKPRAT